MRRERILTRRHISVGIPALKLASQGSQVLTTFEQHDRAGTLDERVDKCVVLTPLNGRWLISKMAVLR